MSTGSNQVPAIQLTNFRFLSPLGAGGMGTVYLAEQLNPRRSVAIKVISPEDHLPRPFLDSLKNEGDIAAQFDHENLMTVYECGIVEDHYYLAMQYLPGGDLEDRIRKGMSTKETLRVIRALADALRHVHAAGVIHRDVKPANVLFSESGKPVLADYGIAKNPESVGALTSAGYSMGTPAYMSPEQITNQPLDGRSDLYSLGVVLYECLTGTPPFAANSEYELKQAHVTEAPAPLPPRLEPFQSVIDGLLAKSPEKRFANGDELIAALDRIDPQLGGETTSLPDLTGTGKAGVTETRSPVTLWFREMTGRRVFRVLAVYVAVAWGLTEIIGGMVDRIAVIPSSVATAAMVAFVVGFPVVLVLAWLFDVGPGGLIRVPTRRKGMFAATVALASVVSLTWLFLTLVDGGDRQGLVPLDPAEPPGRAQTQPVLAVMPFEIMGGDLELQALAGGIAEDLINAISRVPGLKVKMRRSTEILAAQGLSVDEIAGRLGATHLVRASLERVGGTITIRASLVDRKEIQLWGERFSEDLSNVLIMQQDIARAIARRLGAKPDPATSAVQRVVDPEAYALLSRARMELYRGDPIDSIDRLIEYAQRAADKDPDFAEAYSVIGVFHAVKVWAYALPPSPNMALAETNLRLAQELNPTLSEVHAGWAVVHLVNGEWRQANAAVERYLESQHNLVNVENIAAVLNAMGHFERAADLMATAVEADPSNPIQHMMNCMFAGNAGRFETARRSCELILSLGSGFDAFADRLANILMRTKGDRKRIRVLLARSAVPKLNDPALSERFADAVLDPLLRADLISDLEQRWRAGELSDFWYAHYVYRIGTPSQIADVGRTMYQRYVPLNALGSGLNADTLFSGPNDRLLASPDFVPLMETFGLASYWKDVELPDFCQLENEELRCQ